ncbi:MAG: DUF4097 domain-containing protein [Clostridiales bacterium]|jgi:hypothetical protein|nr:DUF4097 domain-containing protein [Clostridiales bacterium]
MNEGRMKVLEMLQEGKIGVEEAMGLLKQFPEEDAPREERRDSGGGFLSELGDTISGAISDAIDASDGVFGGWQHGRKTTKEFVSDPITADIAAIKLLGKNGPVEIRGYEGNQVKIEVKYNAKRGDAQVFVREEGGVFELLYDYNALRWLAVDCLVPNVLVGQIHGESKNSKVELYNIRAEQVALITKNSKIEMGNVNAPQIVAKTRNANIEAKNLQTVNLDLQTGNAKIDIENVKAKIARLTTSNAKIATENVDIEQLYLKTSNGNIKLENMFNEAIDYVDARPEGSQYPPGAAPATERIIEAQTSNSGITVNLPADVAVDVQASTSNAGVECKIPNLVLNEFSKNYINGRTFDYDTHPRRLKLSLNTSNAAVKIR